ncbi:MAG: type II secretion system protein [Candidatus Yanofskybacteria bacterium]|nr:type II secretion system protein [Candidatus Yanofskybacteria bacterium]
MSKGFTLIELLVVITVIGMVSTVMVLSWRQGQDSLALQRATQKLAQDIRRASELALRAQTDVSQLESPCGSGSITGYGISFPSVPAESYVLFGDCDGSRTYEAGTDAVLRTVFLEQKTTVIESPFSVMFTPPEPKVYVNGFEMTVGSAEITLQSGEEGDTRIITVYPTGTIEVQ